MRTSEAEGMDISRVRRNIQVLFVLMSGVAMLVLLVSRSLILQLSPQATWQSGMAYVLLMLVLCGGGLILIHRYLRPITTLARAQRAGQAISARLMQKARDRAFAAPLYFMLVPAVGTFVVATVLDILSAFLVEGYVFAERYLISIMLTITAVVLSLVMSVVVRRMLTPVLLFTSVLAEDRGPRFSIRLRQFLAIFLLTFTAIAFLGVLGYNLVVQGGRYALQERYTFLAEGIAGNLDSSMADRALLDYIASLDLGDGYAFVLNATTGEILTEVDAPHEELRSVAGVLTESVEGVPAGGRTDPVRVLDGEVLWAPLARPAGTWWLGIFYQLHPLEIPVVRQSFGVLAGFVVVMFLLTLVVSHYLSEDLSLAVTYVARRMRQLAQGQRASYERLGVLSRDEVGDLVVAFNQLLDRVEKERSSLARDEEELRALLDLSRDIGLLLDTSELLAQVIQSMARVFGYRNAAIFLVDEDADEVYVAAYPDHQLPSLLGERWPIEAASVVGRVVTTGSPQLMQEGVGDTYLSMAGGVRSELAVPMTLGGRTIGVFDLVSDEPDAFALADLHRVTAVADQVAMALHNAELYREVEEQRQTASSLAQMAKIVNSTLDLDQVLSVALERLEEVIPYDSASIMLAEGTDLVVTAARGFENVEQILGSVFHAEDERNIGYRAMLAQRVRVVPDVRQLSDWGHDEGDIEELDVVRAWIGAPLVVKGRSLGLLTLDSHLPNFYDEADGRLAGAFADQIAVAVQNARLYQTAQDRARELALLHEISRQISALLDIDELLNEIVRRVSETFGYQIVSVHLVDEATGLLRFAAQHGLNEDFVRDHVVRVDDRGIVPEAVQQRVPLLVPDVTIDPRYVAAAPGIRSELAIPLLVGDEVIGVFNLESERVDAFSEGDVQLMTALAQQVAIAMHNANLFEDVRHQAAELSTMAYSLAEEKGKLDAILKNIVDGLLVTDPEGVITLVNPAFEQMFARSASEVVGRSLNQAFGAGRLASLASRALANRQVTFMAEIPMPDGRTFKAAAAAIEDVASLGTVTVIRDVTHEKEVDAMKTEFISTISHELRTPLTSVLGFAKLIHRVFDRDIVPQVQLDDERTERAVRRVRNNLDIIVVEAERLTRLINDVLDISKMESGAIEWHDTSFDLAALVREAGEHARTAARQKGLTIDVEVPDAPVPLVADRARIRQVVQNLLSNALKFTEEGGITLSVRPLSAGEVVHGWRVPAEAEGGVVCSVADTGVGIEPAALPRLFKRFQQVVADTLTGKPQGTGLGLAICHEIVSHYGGEIWAEPGASGATFSFALPVRPMPRKAEPEVVSEPRRRVPPSISPSSDAPLLLIVDDEAHIRSLWAQELEGVGYRVMEAANGSEALNLARHTSPPPALILLDIMLPDISGFDVVRILKSDPGTHEIPILILSIVEDREQGLSLGAEGYLVKPVETPELLGAVSEILARHASRTPGPPDTGL